MRSDTLGWGSTGVLVPLIAGIALLGAFAYVEARVASAPLVPLSIFRLRRLRAANLIVLLMYAANFPAWFFITLYLQQVLHYDAIEAGLAFLPMTASIFLGSSLAPRAVARFGPRRVIAVAMLALAAGMLELSGIAPGGTYIGNVLVGALLTALGMGFSLVPATIVAMSGVPGSQSGLASGVLNTSRLMGGALGLAILSTLAAGRTRAEAAVGPARALTDGFDRAFIVGTGFALVAVLVAVVSLRAVSQASAAEPVAALAGEADDEDREPVLAA